MTFIAQTSITVTAFGKPQPTTVRVLVEVKNQFGDNSDSAVVTVYLAGSVNNGDGTWTLPRPAAGAGDLSVRFDASSPGYPTVSYNYTVPQQDTAPVLAPPFLSVGPLSVLTSTVSMPYTATGATITWYIDGVSQGTPGSSPLVANRDASGGSDHTISMTVIGDDSTTETQSWISPVQPTTVTDPSGGATVDTQCRASLTALTAALRAKGLIA